MTGANGSPAYDVIFSSLQLQRIVELHDEALKRGLGEEFLAVLKVVQEQLRTAPATFGDPLYRLPAAKLIVYVRAIFPIVIDYGVHQEKPVVFIRSIALMR